MDRRGVRARIRPGFQVCTFLPHNQTPHVGCVAMHRHLKNNTPVNTEVLWGVGLWWGLWAGAPVLQKQHQVGDRDSATIDQIAHA